MRNLIGVLLIITVYALVYYRLMVRHYYEKSTQQKESAFGTLFSFPPYKKIPPEGRKYVIRYWIALSVMLCCIAAAAYVTNFSYLNS